MANFKLVSLKLKDNDIFSDLDVQLYDKSDHPQERYTTLIIGPNGTGKSFLLRVILSLFTKLDGLKKTKKRNSRVVRNFSLTYNVN